MGAPAVEETLNAAERHIDNRFYARLALSRGAGNAEN